MNLAEFSLKMRKGIEGHTQFCYHFTFVSTFRSFGMATQEKEKHTLIVLALAKERRQNCKVVSIASHRSVTQE